MVTCADILEEYTASIFRETELPQMNTEVVQRSLGVFGQSWLRKAACEDKQMGIKFSIPGNPFELIPWPRYHVWWDLPKCQNIGPLFGTEPQNKTTTWMYCFYRQSKAATELSKNVFFMLHTKNNFSSRNKDNPVFWLFLSECSFNCITSLTSQSMHLTFLASMMLVVLLTMEKTNHYPSVLSFTAQSEQLVCTKTNSFSPSTVLTSHILCYLPTQPKHFLPHITSASTWT